jgi:hypothetical protein
VTIAGNRRDRAHQYDQVIGQVAGARERRDGVEQTGGPFTCRGGGKKSARSSAGPVLSTNKALEDRS